MNNGVYHAAASARHNSRAFFAFCLGAAKTGISCAGGFAINIAIKGTLRLIDIEHLWHRAASLVKITAA